MFKTFDNTDDDSVTGRYTIHSAFEDPTTKPEDPARESVEVRVVAIFQSEKEDDEPPVKRARSSSCLNSEHA